MYLGSKKCVRFTCIPALAVSVLGPLDPRLVPGVCKVDEQNELDEDEGEGAHHAKVIPHWEREDRRRSYGMLVYTNQNLAFKLNKGYQTSVRNSPVVNWPTGIKKAPTAMPTSARNLKNQKLEEKRNIIYVIPRRLQLKKIILDLISTVSHS